MTMEPVKTNLTSAEMNVHYPAIKAIFKNLKAAELCDFAQILEWSPKSGSDHDGHLWVSLLIDTARDIRDEKDPGEEHTSCLFYSDLQKQIRSSASKKESPEFDGEIAATIVQQMGGNMFKAMTGAICIAVSNGIIFHLPSAARLGITIVKIILNGRDLYDMEFAKSGEAGYVTVKTFADVYFDAMPEIFAEETGLVLSL